MLNILSLKSVGCMFFTSSLRDKMFNLQHETICHNEYFIMNAIWFRFG